MKLPKNLFFLLLLSVKALSQTVPSLPKIIPPSPTVQNFMRYGEIPVDYSTGVPNISIPIYTLEGKKLNVPISISYHASGIKVNDIASEVGLGWVLNAGGLVSRTVFSQPDGTGAPRTFSYANQLINKATTDAHFLDRSCCCFRGIINVEDYLVQSGKFENEDTMSDRFFYKLPDGTSGVFRKGFFSDSIITLPYKPYKIETQNGIQLDSIKITDNNGTIYKFNRMSNTSPDAMEWYLTEMQSGDGTETISFQYRTNEGEYTMGTRSQVFGSRLPITISCNPPSSEPFLSLGSSAVTYHPPVLEKIVSSTAIVSFSYASREDFNMLRLSEISISPASAPTQVIKRVRFTPKYFGSTNADKRLGLDYIIISDNSGTTSSKYSFVYESQTLPPYSWKIQSDIRYNEDYWGYYNGSNSYSSIPADFISNASDRGYYGSNREANLSLSRACMLREIQYPTGGRTVFEFERPYSPSLYEYKNAGGYFGPFRVASITNYSAGNEIAEVKSFEYQNARWRLIRPHYFKYDQVYHDIVFPHGQYSNDCFADYTRELVFSSSTLPLEVAPGMQVMYRTVIEFNGTKTNNTGKTVYEYQEPYAPWSYDNNPIHPAQWEQDRFYHPFHYDRGNYVPQMLDKTNFRYNGKAYIPLSKEEYKYNVLFSRELHTGFKLTRPQIFTDPAKYFVFDCYLDIIGTPSAIVNQYIESIVAIDTKAYQEASVLSNSKNYTFDPLDSTKYVLANTDYTYDQNHLQIKEKTTFSSKGDTLKTINKYPSDFPADPVAVALRNRNQLTPVLEEELYKGSGFLQKTKVRYDNWGNNIIEPKEVQVQKAAGPLETLVNYLSYDKKGNVGSLKKAGGVPVTYLWGYQNILPVAKVENAKLIKSDGAAAYQSFYFVDFMNANQRYFLNGVYSTIKAGSTTIMRQYLKGDDHSAWFYVYIYDAGHNLITSYSDYMSQSQTSLTVSSQMTLAGGSYTVEISSSNPSNKLYTHEVGIIMEGPAGDPATLPVYTSFEEDEVATDAVYFKTGRKSHFGDYTISLPPCPADENKYVLSYWIKLNAGSAWKLVTQAITVPAYPSSIVIGTSGSYIDELRVYPESALMTTFTYDPLVGITSEIDPRNRITTYEYDSLQRLKIIRDYDNKILKSYDYHLKP
ncbi:hypothetical protein [Pararcticibacter amylolyticus]|uniref:Sugar-binding protein n=1 Tax=Pararcticibacter amylolyticus TaxID=2173175 RepID=A0A2U2P987_9SPHI|nr:hypothetical protein [Pararcticibacter amylolyticus]PWG77947.1 hypothetical protein DDR33_24830 [Pararcticibacter amylolyticus]